ncbi:MAG: hypothetical protein AAFW75_08425 [Cyanobacteria bacterium J06636_16]
MKRVFRLFPPRRQTIKEKRIAECYTRSPEGHVVVRLRLSSPTALLMPFEGFPANFGIEAEDKVSPVLNLNKDFVDYLFARLAELEDESLLLRINLPEESTEKPTSICSADVIQTAIHRYFAYLEDVRRQDLQKLAWDAALLGVLGTATLGLSVLLEARNANADIGIGLLLLSQGVTVFGWLTLWEALANVLWHWRPLYQQLRMCQRLQMAQLELAAN